MVKHRLFFCPLCRHASEYDADTPEYPSFIRGSILDFIDTNYSDKASLIVNRDVGTMKNLIVKDMEWITGICNGNMRYISYLSTSTNLNRGNRDYIPPDLITNIQGCEKVKISDRWLIDPKVFDEFPLSTALIFYSPIEFIGVNKNFQYKAFQVNLEIVNELRDHYLKNDAYSIWLGVFNYFGNQ